MPSRTIEDYINEINTLNTQLHLVNKRLNDRLQMEYLQLHSQIDQYKAENQTLKKMLSLMQPEYNSSAIMPPSQTACQTERISDDKIEQLQFLRNLLFKEIEQLTVERNQLSVDLDHERLETIPILKLEIQRLNGLLLEQKTAPIELDPEVKWDNFLGASANDKKLPIVEPSQRRRPPNFFLRFTVTEGGYGKVNSTYPVSAIETSQNPRLGS